MINVQVKGLNNLKSALSKVPVEMKVELQKAIAKSAYVVERESKKVTPVDTGRLRSSIRSSISYMKAVIAPHTDYAEVVHEGGGGRKGRPFMRWGLSTSKKQIEIIFGLVIAKILKNIEYKTK